MSKFNWLTTYDTQDIYENYLFKDKQLEDMGFETHSAKEMYDKATRKYESKYSQLELDQSIIKSGLALARRRNITNILKNATVTMMSYLQLNSPKDTGNLQLNGIRYRILSRNEAIVSIGFPSAPYGVYINIGTIREGWIEEAVKLGKRAVKKESKGTVLVDYPHNKEDGYVEVKLTVMED